MPNYFFCLIDDLVLPSLQIAEWHDKIKLTEDLAVSQDTLAWECREHKKTLARERWENKKRLVREHQENKDRLMRENKNRLVRECQESVEREVANEARLHQEFVEELK